MAAAIHYCQKFFNRTPTVWYPPWNVCSLEMEQAAKTLGLEIDNETYDIWRFIREIEGESYEGHSVYFHGWKKDEMELFPRMLELAKQWLS